MHLTDLLVLCMSHVVALEYFFRLKTESFYIGFVRNGQSKHSHPIMVSDVVNIFVV